MGEIAFATSHSLPAMGCRSLWPSACSALGYRANPAYVPYIRRSRKRDIPCLVPRLWLNVEGTVPYCCRIFLCLYNLKGEIHILGPGDRIRYFTHIPVHQLIQGRNQESIACSLKELYLNLGICHQSSALCYIVHPFVKGSQLRSIRSSDLVEG